MRFLNPSMLWFLPLAALPVLIHFLFSVKPFRLEFSSLFLLRRVGLARRRPARLLAALVLLLRCLALLAAALAFARPVVDSGPLSRLTGLSASGGRPLSLVVLADRSCSMSASFGGRTRYAHAAGVAERALAYLGDGDEAALVFFDEEAAPAVDWTNDRGALSAALAASGPGWRATDYRKALEKAYAMLAARAAGRKKAVLLLTDSAGSGLAGFPRSVSELAGYDPQVRLAGLSFPDAPGYLLSATDAREGARGSLELTARADGACGGGEPFSGEARLFADGPAGKALAGRFRHGSAAFDLAAPGADPAGRVRLSPPDALERDDSAWFAFRRAAPPAAPAALAVHEGERSLRPGGGAYFLKKYFDSAGAAGPAARADFTQYAELERASGGGYGVLLLAGPPPDRRWAEKVRAFLSSGGGVFIAALPEGREGRADCAAWEELGLECGGAADGRFTLAAPAAEASGGWDLYGYDLSRAGARRVLALAGKGFEAPLVFRDEAGGARAALLYGRVGRGRLLVWTSTLGLAHSDLAAKPLFAPLMSLGLRKLFALEAPQPRAALVGGSFEERLADADSARVAVTAPGGTRSFVFAEGGVFRFGPLGAPGLYRWSAGRESGVFAANLDHRRGESCLAPAKAPPWRVLRGEDPAGDLRSALYGAEISQLLLLLALALFLAEFLLSRKAL